MKKTYIWGAVAVVILLIIGFAYNKKVGAPGAGGVDMSKEPIKIGAVVSLTGVAASFGEMSKYGIDLAVDEINAAGGVNGRPVAVVYGDDQTDPKTAVGMYQKLTSIDRVDAIIGSNFDFVTQPVFALASSSDTVVVSPSNPRISGGFDTNRHSFVMMSDFSKIVSELTNYLAQVDHKQLAIVRFESVFSEQISRTLNDIELSLKKPAIITETYKQIGNNDYKTIILKLKKAGADIVFLDMVATDPLTFVNQAKQLGYSPKIITHAGIEGPLAMKGVDTSIFDGIVVLDWNASSDVFKSKFEAKYKLVPTNSANRAYDAVYILSKAVADANSDKARIVSSLESQTFVTPNGPFKFTPEHAAGKTPVQIVEIKGGKYVLWTHEE